MATLYIGLLSIIAVLLFAVGGTNFSIFLNSHAIVIVALGSLSVLILQTPSRDLKNTIVSLLRLLKPEKSHSLHRSHLLLLSDYRQKSSSPKRVGASHPLILYAEELWEQGIETRLFKTLLVHKMEELNHSSESSVAVMRNIPRLLE